MVDLDFLRKKRARFIIGLMSGSSSDGIDAVLVRIKGTGPDLAIKLVAYQSFPFDRALRTRLLDEHMTVRDVCLLNFELGERFADAAKALMGLADEHQVLVDFIASHGQTIAHVPPRSHDKIGTLQIGEPAVIAERTGLPVVSDFRQRDMAAGGQGAPLVPYADWLLFHKLEREIACLNIGGIANFTVVTPEIKDILAFDVGPANMAIDGAVRLLTRGTQQMDKDGAAAHKGLIIDEFLEYLLGHKYFSKNPPKSTGREEFGVEVYLRDALASRKEHAYEDLIATVTSSVAANIVSAYNRFIKPVHECQQIIVGGGGAKNKTLMTLLRKGMPDVPIFTSDQYGIPDGAREAVAIAILGNETICGTPANIPQATGATHPVVLGKITP